MAFLDTIKAKVGEQSYRHIEKEAEKEIAIAMRMELKDRNYKDQYHTPRFLLGELLGEFDSFEKAGLKVTPFDLLTIVFKCKLLCACQTQEEFGQRTGGLYPMLVDNAWIVRWSEKGDKVNVLIERHVDQLEKEIGKRILVAPVNSFTSIGDMEPQIFFDNLFTEAKLPFVGFFDGNKLVELHKQFEPWLISYDCKQADNFFSAPSIGFECTGSRNYCFWRSTVWLRTFLNLLRIGGYMNPGQIERGMHNIKMTGPTFPVFVGDHSGGLFRWDEDQEESWAKIPDGALFRSFGWRGLSKAWFDKRSFPGLKNFFLDNSRIFECLKNPWNSVITKDVAPSLDILSTATQIPDMGAKILLIYCCLEHLFVPKNIKSDNTKYIVGAMNAIAPGLLPWFDKLYDLRCDYAHKGFVLRDDDTLRLTVDSIKNAMALLIAKLHVP